MSSQKINNSHVSFEKKFLENHASNKKEYQIDVECEYSIRHKKRSNTKLNIVVKYSCNCKHSLPTHRIFY